MGKDTNIAWCHSTWNPWIGCTEVSTAESGGGGCDDCYAKALDNRHRWGGATHWGAGVPRMRTSAAYWKQPLTWNRKAAAIGQQWRVFCASLADVFDNEVADKWRDDLFHLIADTPALTWLLLTKRIGNAARMMQGYWPMRNVWIGVTIVNQMEADRDAGKLLSTPAAKRFVSYEPALGPVDWTKYPGIDWIIVGGASRQLKAAPAFDLKHARDTIAQCREIGAAPFVKQLGAQPQDIAYPEGVTDAEAKRWMDDGWTRISHAGAFPTHWRKYLRLKDRAGADPDEWPDDLRVREFPT